MGIEAMEINEHLFHKLIEEAVSYERAEKWLHAAQIYERMLAEMPDSHYLRYNLAKVYARLGNINAAENAIITAIKEGADEIRAYEELCKILLQYDEYTRVIEILSKLAIRLHSSPGVHFLLALAYSAQGDFQNAHRHLLRTLEMDPKYHKAHLAIGDVLIKLDKFEEAVEHLRMAVTNDPDDWSALHLLGVAYFKLDKNSEALEVVGRALEIVPERADLMRLSADILIRMEELDRAELLLRRAVSRDKNSSEIQTSFAFLALARNDVSAAIKYFNHALDLDPYNARALEGLQLLQPYMEKQ